MSSSIENYLLKEYHQPGCTLYAAEWSMGDQWIACSTGDKTVLLMEVRTGSIVGRFDASGIAIAWSPESHHLLTCSENMACTWDIMTHQQGTTYLHGEEGSIEACTWSPDGKRIATSGYGPEPSVWVWEAVTGELLSTFSPREPFDAYQAELAQAGLPVSHPSFYPIQWSPQGTFLAFGQQHKIHIWCPSTDTMLFSYEGAIPQRWQEVPEPVRTIAWSADERYLACAFGQVIEVWDWRKQEQIASYQGHTDNILLLTWFSKSHHILSMSSHLLCIWDARTGVCSAQSLLDVGEQSVVLHAALSVDQTSIALAGVQYQENGEEVGSLWVWKHNIELSKI